MKKIGSTNALNVVAQFDRRAASHQTHRYFLRKGGNLESDVVDNLGETNAGDPGVLTDFIVWSVKNYPAARYMLVIWNHGGGWDDTDVYRLARRVAGANVTRRGAPILAANFSPDDRVWMRLLDVGIDSFFAQPNDLVVPTAGGWHIDKGVNSYVPPERIGCFGAGGNLAGSVPVYHLNFFQQPDSTDFIVDALARKPHPLRPIDPLRLLPGRRAAGAVAGRFLPRAAEAIDRRDEPMSAPSVEIAQSSRMVEPLGVAPGSLAPVDTFFS
jgi:Clostripain family